MVDTRISSIEAMQSTFRKMSRRGQLELRNYSREPIYKWPEV